ncbi:MAG: M56 family metallopeptidase [Bacteroidota bacterium]
MTANSIFRYFYESGLSLVLLYALYHIFFRRETYFRFNRVYLLSILLFSALLPLLSLPALFSGGSSMNQGMVNLAEFVKYPDGSSAATGNAAGSSIPVWQLVLLLVYLAGAGLILFRFISGMVHISRIRARGRKEINSDHTIIYMEENLAPFSFFRTVFLNEQQAGPSRRPYIMEHELVHIRQRHTLDNLFMELMLALFWFNPVLWLLRRSLRGTHEFLADQGIKKEHSNLGDYQSVLLSFLQTAVPLPISNNFNSLIKKRIQMMYKRNSSVLARMKPLFILPVLMALTFVFACTENEPKDEAVEILKSTAPDVLTEADTSTAAEELFYIVEEMPTFNGGDPSVEFRKYIAQNLIYPEIAKQNGIQGRVIVQFTVNSKGQAVDAVVVRSVDPSLDAEAVRVIEASPAWTPGKQRGKEVGVLFTFPINFVLP